MGMPNKFYIPYKEEIIKIHDYLIEIHGGLKGVFNKLDYVPYCCKNYFSQNVEESISFLLSRLSKGHYFVDGNKRTAYFTSKFALLSNGLDFDGISVNDVVKEMDNLARLSDNKSLNYARKLVKKNLMKVNYKLDSYNEFENFVLKNIAVSNKLSMV
jgi:death-on-curing protein